MDILKNAEEELKHHFEMEGIPLPFHNLRHAMQVKSAATAIAEEERVNGHQLVCLQLASLFHDSGYIYGSKNHEERGAGIACEFLKRNGKEDWCEEVEKLILATRHDLPPESLAEKIICDADLSYLGTRDYHKGANALRDEMLQFRNRVFDDKEWLEFNLKFFEQHRYYTNSACELFGATKENHQLELINLLNQL